MFYAKISNDLKELAADALAQYLETGPDAAGGARLLDLAPYLLGFIGVQVDHVCSAEFGGHVDDCGWMFSDITDSGYFFEGTNRDGEENSVLFLPAAHVHALRFLFRDSTAGAHLRRRAAALRNKPAACRESAALDAVDQSDRVRPGMFRNGEDVE